MKKIILMAVALFAMVTANAQVAGNEFFDNWSIGVNVGGTTPLDFDGVFPVNPTAGITVQKAITPYFAFRVDGTAMFGSYNVGEYGTTPLAVTKTFVKATNVGLNGVLNWTNILGNYKGEPRVFEVSTVGGLGWLHSFSSDKAVNHNNDLTAKAAVNLAFNLGKEKAWQVFAEPGVYWNLTAGEKIKFNKEYAQLGVNVGVVYKFMTSNGTHNFINVRLYEQAEVDGLNTQINALKGELAKKPKVIVKEIVSTATNTVCTTENSMGNVYFAFDSAELTQEAKNDLDKIGTNVTVTVTGYASSEGTAEHNQGLSERRAQAVADYLTKRGVKVTKVVGKGVAPYEFNRTVVIK